MVAVEEAGAEAGAEREEMVEQDASSTTTTTTRGEDLETGALRNSVS